jgi:hypothetical protein
MKIPAWRPLVALVIAALAGRVTSLSAQGITTGAIAGTVTNEQGAPLEGIQIQVTQNNTGYKTTGVTRANGSYRIQGLEIGGPYSVSARRIGLAPQTKNAIVVNLGQTARVDFQLTAQAAQLEAIQVISTTGAVISSTKTGVGKMISDSMISRLQLHRLREAHSAGHDLRRRRLRRRCESA